MREFQADGRTISAYLAVPEHGSGPGVLGLHAWWGLTEPFRQVCDRLAEAEEVVGPREVVDPGQPVEERGVPQLERALQSVP